MSQGPVVASLPSRAVVRVSGPDWRPFLHNLLTHDIEGLPDGEARFAGLLTPQGRLLYDLFVVATEEGALVDVAGEHRDALIQRLMMYRLRAKVEIAPEDIPISAFFSAHPGEGRPIAYGKALPLNGGGLGGGASTGSEDSGTRGDIDTALQDVPESSRQHPHPRPSPIEGEGRDETVCASPALAGMSGVWVKDPRLPSLGYRIYGQPGDQPEAAYDAHRLALGVPGPADWGSDRTYPIEANFDLLNGIDFKKGCFVGQETTSRMHRRGTVKTRMAPVNFDGPPPPFGTEILNGELRAGEVLSGMHGWAMAALRLDRLEGALMADGRGVTAKIPDWMNS